MSAAYPLGYDSDEYARMGVEVAAWCGEPVIPKPGPYTDPFMAAARDPELVGQARYDTALLIVRRLWSGEYDDIEALDQLRSWGLNPDPVALREAMEALDMQENVSRTDWADDFYRDGGAVGAVDVAWGAWHDDLTYDLKKATAVLARRP